MPLLHSHSLAAALFLSAVCAAPHATAQTEAPAPAKAAKPKVNVSAPNAQRLIAKVAAAHADVALIGLHADVPGAGANAIIACNDLPRVGKPSSPGDLALIGKPQMMVARLPAKNVYEVAMAIHDAQGRSVGMFVDQMKISVIKDEADALKRALAVRAEIERGIPDEAWLFAAN